MTEGKWGRGKARTLIPTQPPSRSIIPLPRDPPNPLLRPRRRARRRDIQVRRMMARLIRMFIMPTLKILIQLPPQRVPAAEELREPVRVVRHRERVDPGVAFRPALVRAREGAVRVAGFHE